MALRFGCGRRGRVWCAAQACALGVCLWLGGCATTGPRGVAQPSVPSVAAGAAAGPWTPWHMPGKEATDYRITVAVDGSAEIHARAQASASVFRRAVNVPAAALGELRFEWQVHALMHEADLASPERADSPARVVLGFDGDRHALPLRDQLAFDLAHALTGEMPPYATLMYVWDNALPVGTVLPGGRSRRIRKIVVASGPEALGRWQAHQRDIVADFRLAFGEAPGALLGVGVMTDSDNTRSFAEARYRQIVVRDRAGQAH